MIKCVRCGTTNLEAAEYCDECGAKSIRNQNQSVYKMHVWQSGQNDTDNGNLASDISELQPNTIVDSASNPELETKVVTANAQDQLNNKLDSAIGVVSARLRIERGKNTGKEFVLSENEINIGRWDADNGVFPDVDLDADDPEAKVSRRHARIVRRDGQYQIEDLGSTNGTFVNRGRRLLPGNFQNLAHGDEVIVGKTFLRFEIINPKKVEN